MASIETTSGVLGWPKSCSNPPTQLVSIAFNMMLREQKAKLGVNEERRKNMKK